MREYMIRRRDGSEYTFLVHDDDTPPVNAVLVDRTKPKDKGRRPRNKDRMPRVG